MGNHLIDLTGQRFGRLEVIGFSHFNKHHQAMWRCRCDCGNETIVVSGNLRTGKTQSCDCLRRERCAASNRKNLKMIPPKHGKTNTRLYRIWGAMRSRCYNPNTANYHNYGGRGITVCEEWRKDFQSFYTWSMEHGYKSDLSIDRIDNEQGYGPDNCKWSSRKEQANNTRQNHVLNYNGEAHTTAEWSDITGISRTVIVNRLRRGWDVEKALTTPVKIGANNEQRS